VQCEVVVVDMEMGFNGTGALGAAALDGVED
jgi:hypothetical protein